MRKRDQSAICSDCGKSTIWAVYQVTWKEQEGYCQNCGNHMRPFINEFNLLEKVAPPLGKAQIRARWTGGECNKCGETIKQGQLIRTIQEQGKWYHAYHDLKIEGRARCNTT